jgi:hypothetical protein
MMNDVKDKFDNSRLRFRLETQDEDNYYRPEPTQFSFYQICQFAIDKKYRVRKIIYNELFEIVKVSEKSIKKDILEKFLKSCKKNKFVIYPLYDLDGVDFPGEGEIMTANSEILN